MATCTLLIFASAFTGCDSGGTGGGESDGGTPHPSVEGVPDRLTKEEDKIWVSSGAADGMVVSDGWRNNFPFACNWTSSSVTYGDGAMHMTVSRTENGYNGAEIKSRGRFGYGYYSVCMKAAKCSGVVSSFFTYVGNPWDEIDIEFLGKDTTGIQLNYYTSGTGGHEYWYSLGFDGADDFHEYGFDWRKDSITWYVDGKAVYRATANIPVTPGQFMANVWNGEGDNFNEWCGALDGSLLPATAQYRWFAYSET